MVTAKVSSKILNLNIHKGARGGPMAYVEIFDLDQYIDINFLDSIKKEKNASTLDVNSVLKMEKNGSILCSERFKFSEWLLA